MADATKCRALVTAMAAVDDMLLRGNRALDSMLKGPANVMIEMLYNAGLDWTLAR